MSRKSRHGFGVLLVAAFAIVFTRAPWLIKAFNPVMKWLLLTPLPAGPNALLLVRGRKTGRIYSTPVAFLDLGDRALLQAASAEVGWARNLAVTRRATIRRGRKSKEYLATQLGPETAGSTLHDLLASYPRSRLIRTIVGSVNRPPIAVLHYFRIRVDDRLEDYVALARRQPIFELRPSP